VLTRTVEAADWRAKRERLTRANAAAGAPSARGARHRRAHGHERRAAGPPARRLGAASRIALVYHGASYRERRSQAARSRRWT
jgi:hypothetical protein